MTVFCFILYAFSFQLGAKQQWCVICKQGLTSFFCATCGLNVAIHRASSSFKHSTCEGMHRANIRYRADKRSFRALKPQTKKRRIVGVRDTNV